jgi:hypothetical protein
MVVAGAREERNSYTYGADTVTAEANRSVVCRDSRKRNQRAKEKSARE